MLEAGSRRDGSLGVGFVRLCVGLDQKTLNHERPDMQSYIEGNLLLYGL